MPGRPMKLGAFLVDIGLMTRHKLPSQLLKVLLDMIPDCSCDS